MGCPRKLEEIQIMNGIGDFSSKGFSVFGASSSDGPWKRIYKGELEEGKEEVGFLVNFHNERRNHPT